MTNDQIRSRVEKARQKIREHDAKRKVIEAQLLALQHACPHEDTETWDHYDYGGGCDTHWKCKICGLEKVT